jgi:hypothetical protein
LNSSVDMPTKLKWNPAGGGGFAKLARSAWDSYTRGSQQPRQMPAMELRTGCCLRGAADII